MFLGAHGERDSLRGEMSLQAGHRLLAVPHSPLCISPRSYELNYTQELRGLGIANILGALFQCYTTTGSFSRSAVNNSVGCVLGWSDGGGRGLRLLGLLGLLD